MDCIKGEAVFSVCVFDTDNLMQLDKLTTLFDNFFFDNISE